MASATDARFEKGYGCYFYAQAATNLFCGHLDPLFQVAEGFSEGAIADFVKAAKPRLFRQLGGLPVPSTDIRKPDPASDRAWSKPTTGYSSARPTTRHEAVSSTVPPPPQQVEQYMLDLQHKRCIQLRVLNGYDLTIRKMNVPSLVLPCSDPQCAKDTNVIPKGVFFLTLSKSVLDPACAVIKKSVLHYTLTCLEDLFDRGLSTETPYEVDGHIDRPSESELSTSRSRVDKVTSQVDGLVDVSGFPYHYPSNSPEALYLRGKRDNESILRPLTPVRGTRPASPVRTSTSQTPSLKLSRPNDASPFVRRYKKQGLTYESRRKSRTSEQLEIGCRPKASRPEQEMRICYCREAANCLELVQCSSPNCMIGTFHLQCLNLQEPLEEGDEIYCDYCAENLSADDDSETGEDAYTVTGGVHAEDECAAGTASPVPELLEGSNVQGGYPEGTASPATDSGNHAVTRGHKGFVAINDPKTCLSIHRYAQTDGPPSVPAKPYLKPTSTPSSKTRSERQKKQARVSLQPGSSQISFSDLAPFIGLSHLAYSPLGLTNNEARVFLHWKKSCPKSRLLKALPIGERIEKGLRPSEAWYPVKPQGYVLPHEGFAPCKLSGLLDLVSGTENGT